MPSVFSFASQSNLKSQLDRFTRSKVLRSKRFRESLENENEVSADERNMIAETAVVHESNNELETSAAEEFEFETTPACADLPCTTCVDLRRQLEQEKKEHITYQAQQIEAYNMLERECQDMKNKFNQRIDLLNDECERLKDELGTRRRKERSYSQGTGFSQN